MVLNGYSNPPKSHGQLELVMHAVLGAFLKKLGGSGKKTRMTGGRQMAAEQTQLTSSLSTAWMGRNGKGK